MLYSPPLTSCEVNIVFYQRSLLGTSANHNKKQYLKSYNNVRDFVFFLLIYFSIHSVGKKWKQLQNIKKNDMFSIDQVHCGALQKHSLEYLSHFLIDPHSFSKRHQPSQIYVLKCWTFGNMYFEYVST